MSQEILPGFMARSVAASQHDHWIGGSAQHKSAHCAVCDRPFLLIWDLNCRDERFVVDGKSVFETLDRLPLYYCWTCSSRFSYRIAADDIEILEFHGQYQGDDFPYSNYPESFPKTPLQLSKRDEIPVEILEFLEKQGADSGEDEDEDWPMLTQKECAVLTSWLGRPVTSTLDIWWHQLGGEPFLLQGADTDPCPNSKCVAHKTKQPMKILAAIKNDPPSGLPMLETMSEVDANNGHFNHYVQLVYYFCDQCHTIRALNECD
jgi:hypothetical protein